MKEDWSDIAINLREAERFLGYRKIQPDTAIRAMIRECVDSLEETCTPRSVQRWFPIEWERSKADEEGAGAKSSLHLIRIASMEIRSRSLDRNLKGCTQAVLLAATLGPGCDRLVRRAEITSMTRAAVLQAVGAAMIEAYADKVNKDIIQKARAESLYARPRFSPGYGDLPLALQKDFFRILNITREIGVSLSDSLLMTPTKSITAIIGLSPKDASCILAGCETCSLHKTCPYARDAV